MVSVPLKPQSVPALLVFLLLLPAGVADGGPAKDAEVSSCGALPSAWFLGVVHDDGLREDFQKDVDNFELFLSHLRTTYCIPDGNADILAFFNDYTRNGKSYPAATEDNLVARMQAFGAAASAEPDATFFYFHSSHGIVYISSPCSIFVVAGSFANLRGGNLYDCELGRYLNDNFAPHVKMAIVVDCSFCGGFSDSITPVSGTASDGSVAPSGILGPNRIVVTGCAETTECFGGNDGGVLYGLMKRTLLGGVASMDGWTVAGFPTVYGANVPFSIGARDGTAAMSEWVFRSVWSAYASFDLIGIQQQFRIKYGPATLDEDIPIL